MSQKVAARRHVAVFGAGVAGLTAAHELVERGYRVDVYESSEPGVNESVCGVGGTARTQWARVEQVEADKALPTWQQATPRIEPPRSVVHFDPGSAKPRDETPIDVMADFLIEHRGKITRVRVDGFSNVAGDGFDFRRAKVVARELRRRLKAGTPQGAPVAAVAPRGAGVRSPSALDLTDRLRCVAEFAVVEDILPGEDGFRFFPSFYRNLFDTMRRIPIAAEGDPYVETGRTVLDNLVPTVLQRLAFGDPYRRPLEIERRPPVFGAGGFDRLVQMLETTNVRVEDAIRLQLRLLRYMTSCAARRVRYEDQSWWEFIEGDSLEPESFRRLLGELPQILVAMRSKDSDARTVGTVAVQLLSDQLRPGPLMDGTLNGPTSVAWFRHWRRYLENLGVQFFRGKLVALEETGGVIFPVVEKELPDGTWWRYALDLDYYVVAAPPDVVQTQLEELAKHLGPIQSPTPEQAALRDELGRGDLEKIRRLDLGGYDSPAPSGDIAHLTGVQFYFETGISMIAGHTVYPDSPWRLSSIGQPQFWTRKRGPWDGYLGLLSVDIGLFDATTNGLKGKPAWSCTPQELAEDVWLQIRAAVPELPGAVYYHVDELIERDTSSHLPLRNRAPLLVNKPGHWNQRPGRPGDYRIQLGGRFVFAGNYWQTYTRLTTMEASNEAARAAVNALLAADCQRFRGESCRIWNPEDHEPDTLSFLADLDRWLLDAGTDPGGLPHVFDILGVDRSLPGRFVRGLLARGSGGLRFG
jgi:NAD(P)-binding Rossmann-like domain